MSRPIVALAKTAALCLGVGLSGAAAAQNAQAANGAAVEELIQTKLNADQSSVSGQFGSTIAVNGDILVVTAPWADIDGKTRSGAVYIFLRDQNSHEWIQYQRLMPKDGAYNSSEMTIAIAGETIVVGAYDADIETFQEGAVYIFDRAAPGSGDWLQTAKLTATDVGFGGHFGSSISIANDLLAIGASGASQHHGSVRIFERNHAGANSWGELTRIPYTAVNDGGFVKELGSAVALENDLLMVGAARADVSYSNNADGAVYVFQRNAVNRDTWDFATRLIAPDADRCLGGLTVSQFFVTSDPAAAAEAKRCSRQDINTNNDNFGNAIAQDGEIAAIGAQFADSDHGSGAVHLFQRDVDTGRWTHVAVLGPQPGPQDATYFGRSIAIADNRLLVGDTGAGHVFERDAVGPNSWGKTEDLIVTNGGTAVGLSGSTYFVGAPADQEWRGSVYLFSPKVADDSPAPAFPPTGDLVDGGILEGPGGVVLGTVPGALDSQLRAWITEVPAPTLPLDDGIIPISPFYNIGSSVTKTAPDDAPFGMAFPVPKDADTNHLAAAILVRASEVLDGPDDGEFWVFVPGIYDPITNFLSVALDDLAIEGNTVVLVQDPWLQPLPSTLFSATADGSVAFEVKCHGFSSADACTPADEKRYEQYLEDAYAQLTELGFGKPALRNKGVTFASSKQFTSVPTIYRGNVIVPDVKNNCQDADLHFHGQYTHRHIIICQQDNGGLEDVDKTMAKHELFHAFQYGFKAVNKHLTEDQRWIIEGTAAASEYSNTTMEQDGFHPRHPVDRGLANRHLTTNPDPLKLDPYWDPYTPQDFWVYFGLKHGVGLDYLIALFNHGSTTEAANQFFTDVYKSSLGAEYWSWLKNQAMEKVVEIAGGMGAKCTISSSGSVLEVPLGDVPQLQYGPDSPPSLFTASVQSLTGRLIKITVDPGVGPTVISVSPLGLAYKTYVDGDPECATADDQHPEQDRTFASIAAGSVLYLLVANKEYDPKSNITYTVNIAPPPH